MDNGDVQAIKPTREGHLEWRFEVVDEIRGQGILLRTPKVVLISSCVPEVSTDGDETLLHVPGDDEERDHSTVVFDNIGVERACLEAISEFNSMYRTGRYKK